MNHVVFAYTLRRTQINAAAASGLRAGGREKASQSRAAGEEDGGNGDGHGGDGAKVRLQTESMSDRDVPVAHPPYCFVPCRLQNSEQQSKQSDQSDKDMRMELEGKVDALQKQLTDIDTIR